MAKPCVYILDGKRLNEAQFKQEMLNRPELYELANPVARKQRIGKQFIEQHGLTGKIDVMTARPDFGLTSEELSRGIKQIQSGQTERAGAKAILDRINTWEREGEVSYVFGKGGTFGEVMRVPFETSQMVSELNAEQAAKLEVRTKALEKISENVAKEYVDAEGSLDLVKLENDLNDAEKADYFGNLLEATPTEIEALKEIVKNERASPTKKTVNDGNSERPAQPADESATTTGAEPTAAGTEPPATGAGNDSPANVEGGKEKSLLNRAYRGQTEEQVKAAIEKHGRTYDVESHIKAESIADELIADVGIERAIQAATSGEIDGAPAAFVLSKGIEDLQKQIGQSKDVAETQALLAQQARLINEIDVKARTAGRYASALNAIYEKSDFNYSYERQVEKYKATNGGEIPADVEAKMKELDTQLKEVKTKLAEAEERVRVAEEQAAVDNIVETIRNEKKAPEKAIKAAAKRAASKIRELRVIKPDVFNSANPATLVWDGAIELVARIVEGGGTVAQATADGLAYIRESEWYKSLSDKVKGDAERSYLETMASEQEVTPGRIKIPHETIRGLVESGITTIDELVVAVKDLVKGQYPDATDREIRDAITGYGKTANPDMSKEAVQLRKMKRIGRTLSGLEDVQKGERPLRSGLQRDRMDAEERSLTKQLREAMKELPLDAATEEKQLRNSLDAAKSRLRNQIEDLQREIDTNERIPKSERSIEADQELKDLQADRDRLKELHNTIFKDGVLTDEARVNNAIRVTEKSIQQLEERLAKGELESPKRENLTPETPQLKALRDKREALKAEIKRLLAEKNPPKSPEEKATDAAVRAAEKQLQELEDKINSGDLTDKERQSLVQDTPELTALREKIENKRKLLEDMRESAGLIDEKRLELAKNRVSKRIAELEGKIKDSDFAKRQKSQVEPDKELRELQVKQLEIKDEFDKLQYQNELNNRTKSEKWADGLFEAWGLTRALRATGEMSFVAIQGGTQLFSHPLNSAKAFKNAMSHFSSEARSDRWLRELRLQEYYPRLKDSKLSLSEPDAKLTAREEMFLGGWVNHIWDFAGKPIELASKDAYEKFKKANPIKAVERAGTGYLNTLRVERYLQGERLLEASGKNIKDNLEDYKNMADMVNTFTGRASLGALEGKPAKALSAVFFSPRNWASTIKTATPYALWHFGKMTSKGADGKVQVSAAQKMAINDFVKTVAVTGSMVMLAAAGLNSDDDKDTGVEFDPRSSDFMKIKIGNTRVDPWGGKVQQVVLMARLMLDSIKSKGKVKRLGEDRQTATKHDLILSMAENKLAPTASAINKYLSSSVKKEGKEYKRYAKFEKEEYGSSALIENLYPIYWETIAETYKEQPADLATFLTFLAFFGEGVSTYESKSKKKSKEVK